MDNLYANITVSVTELKRNLASVLTSTEDAPVAVLNHNKPEAYLLSAQYYENLLEKLEDAEERLLVKERKDGPFVEVSLDEL